MNFVFRAKNQAGKIKSGRIDAISREAAVKTLQKSNLIPISVSAERKESKILKETLRTFQGANEKDIAIFFQELSIMIDAKVPIVPSLLAIEQQTENKYLKTIIRGVRTNVEDGMPLSEALGKYPEVFTPLTINMIKSGEVSGNLQKTISYLAENIRKRYELKAKIKGALLYPAVVLVAAFVVGFLVFTIIVPRLAIIIADLDVEVPWYTTAIMATGNFMGKNWIAALFSIIATIGGVMYYMKTESGRREWDRWQLKIPVMKDLMRAVYMNRFSDNLSLLMVGGIPVVRSLLIVSDVVNNSVYKSIILRSADEVKSGGDISTVFEQSAEIPPLVTRMIAVGEETGKMSEVLDKVAAFYEHEADNMTRNLSSLIEPFLIILLGLGVGVLAFGVLIPIYDIASKL